MKGEAVQRDTISAPCTQEERAKRQQNSHQTPIIHARKQSDHSYYQWRALPCVRVQSVHFLYRFICVPIHTWGQRGRGSEGGKLSLALSYNAHRALSHARLSKYSFKLEQETGTDAVLAKLLPKAPFSFSHRLWKTTCFPVPVPAELQASRHVRRAPARTSARSPRRSGLGGLGHVQIFV